MAQKLKIAVIGQSQFGTDVYRALRKEHDVVAVFTIPDKDGKPDLLAGAAAADGTKVFKYKTWRKAGKVIPEVLEEYQSVGAQLNVMAYCSQFIPSEVLDLPVHTSINYHPSILPRHRGASAINWTIVEGDDRAGFCVFWPDDGLDTGPVLMMKSCKLLPNDTLNSVYSRFLYPEGVKAMVESVRLVAAGKAPRLVQPTEGATYDPIMKKDIAEVKWEKTAQECHNFVRGCDKVPGAWTMIGDEKVSLFQSQLWTRGFTPRGAEVEVVGCSRRAIVHHHGMLFFCGDGSAINVRQLHLGNSGSLISASDYGKPLAAEEKLVLTGEETGYQEELKKIWRGILNVAELTDRSDFFKLGGGSMDVVRLVEEIAFNLEVRLTSDDVYVNTTFGKLLTKMVKKSRGLDDKKELVFDAVELNVNKMNLKFPRQLFINNEFVESVSGDTYDTVNPTDETAICKISKATRHDVEFAVEAAEDAFAGSWGSMNARDRGDLMYKLAELMETHKEELATLESLDSGAVYTLALKTHVGMSIATLKYFAGWCDKIQGSTIPINNARPSSNLCFTRREPVGVCAIVIPWNYPLMMLAWKISACLAAGNTVVLKPAQVTPLTALKFAELSVAAGFPAGVINILPGSGSVVGQALAEHPRVRKIGFTGSTGIGQQIMATCANANLKKVSLELGGKSPLIIFEDADMEMAVRQACGAVFFNKGENCIAAGRLFVQEEIVESFVEKIIAEVKKMKIGDPLDRSTDHGPQNHRAHLKKLVAYCERGVKEGAKLVYGGSQVDRPGLFMSPTIFTEVDDENFIASEESFGPIMIISTFRGGAIDEVLARANTTEFGLASGVFTRDINKALYVAEKLQAGTVFVNTYNKTDVAAPFGGFKQSGFGKDLGGEALLEWSKTKTVTVEFGI